MCAAAPQIAGATGAVWAAEASWAAASKKVEMQQAAVHNANSALEAVLDTPLAHTAHKALHAADAKLQVRLPLAGFRL
jgi:hypothetical protein